MKIEMVIRNIRKITNPIQPNRDIPYGFLPDVRRVLRVRLLSRGDDLHALKKVMEKMSPCICAVPETKPPRHNGKQGAGQFRSL
ncbi:MAG: hypothetical protein JJT96_18350, partial [Opitutales bacterium]|nr:hypothetical protein [Opitutales bacterium]